MMEKYLERQSQSFELLSCGACGMRDFSSTINGNYKTNMPLNTLPCTVWLTEEEAETFKQLKAEPPITLYVDAQLNTAEVDLWKL